MDELGGQPIAGLLDEGMWGVHPPQFHRFVGGSGDHLRPIGVEIRTNDRIGMTLKGLEFLLILLNLVNNLVKT